MIESQALTDAQLGKKTYEDVHRSSLQCMSCPSKVWPAARPRTDSETRSKVKSTKGRTASRLFTMLRLSTASTMNYPILYVGLSMRRGSTSSLSVAGPRPPAESGLVLPLSRSLSPSPSTPPPLSHWFLPAHCGPCIGWRLCRNAARVCLQSTLHTVHCMQVCVSRVLCTLHCMQVCLSPR